MTMAWAPLETMSRTAVEQMALSLAAGSVIAACAWTLLRLAPRRDSASRFALWFAALLAIALLPVAGAVWHSPAGPGAGDATPALITVPASWANLVFAVWAAIASLALLRVSVGLWQLRRLRRNCAEIAPEALGSEAAEVMACAGRPVKLCTSAAVRVPTAIGFGDPAVILPRWLLAEIPADELKQVILHELAHLERRDDWTNLVQKVVRALLFFHPVVWWIESRLSLEREMACDDAVLARTARPWQYAECLARLAEKSLGRRGAELAQAAVSRVRQTSLRVAQILDGARPQPGRAWTLAGMLVVLAAGITGLSAGRSQHWIAFSSDAPEAMATAAVVPVAYRPALATTVQPVKVAAAPNTGAGSLQAAARPATVPVRSAPSRDALVLARNVRARNAGADVGFVLTIFTQESTATSQGWKVEMWHITVWVPEVPPAKQVPQKST